MKRTLFLIALLTIAAFAKSQTPDTSLAKQDQIFTSVEIQPSCKVNFISFIAQNVRYPINAFKNGIQGKVFVQFIVRRDGKVSDAKVVHSVSPDLDAEALRVVNLSPGWRPGIQNGQPVSVSFVVPINFNLNTFIPPKTDTAKAANAGDELSSQSAQQSGPAAEANIIFSVVEIEPTFNGSFDKYVKKNIRYSKNEESSGTVVLSFVVEKDGSVSEIKIRRSLNEEEDAEAVRLLQNSPKWNPGMQNGKAVSVYFMIQVKFDPQN